MLFIGIDSGASSVKLLVMSYEGRVKKIVTKEYPIYIPKPGWSEQNLQDWFDMGGNLLGIRYGGEMIC